MKTYTWFDIGSDRDEQTVSANNLKEALDLIAWIAMDDIGEQLEYQFSIKIINSDNVEKVFDFNIEYNTPIINIYESVPSITED